ncbi:hypothetical protein GCM10025867_48920 (plasmid) [Frondihabitans sucicola]|uniref:Serine protease n=1 Tax=Frondihabitans sucicola TaxID=1268041 RepID=A0ABN6Y9I0_9MICO|nr:hypothetical protein GCM10025867_48920 [Frondihabitans sucicola]
MRPTRVIAIVSAAMAAGFAVAGIVAASEPAGPPPHAVTIHAPSGDSATPQVTMQHVSSGAAPGSNLR